MAELSTDVGPDGFVGQHEGNGAALSEPDPAPRRRRGRPKGLGKVPGSGRKKREITLADMAEAAESFVLDILEGNQVYSGPAGSVGKSGWRYPPMELRLKTALALIDKRHANLQSITQDVKAKVEGRPIHDPRQLARVIVGLLRDAVPDADVHVTDRKTAYVAVTDPDLLPIVGGEEIASTSLSDALAGLPEPAERVPQVGMTIPVGDAGHFISLAEIERGTGRQRWWLHREDGLEITTVWGRADAEAGMHQYISTGQVSR